MELELGKVSLLVLAYDTDCMIQDTGIEVGTFDMSILWIHS